MGLAERRKQRQEERERREEVQKIVREEAAAGGDPKAVRQRIRDRVNARFSGKPGINPVIMGLLLQLAMAIFMEWWNSRKQKDDDAPKLALEDLDDDDLEASDLC